MAGDISLDNETERGVLEEERGLLWNLEEKIEYLLIQYQELKKERGELAIALGVEKEKIVRLEKKLELISQDREKVKGRIDQLLLRLKGIDI